MKFKLKMNAVRATLKHLKNTVERTFKNQGSMFFQKFFKCLELTDTVLWLT